MKKVAPKAGKKKEVKPAGPGAIAAGGAPDVEQKLEKEEPEEVPTYSATGLDNALDLLDVVTAKMDKASVGQQAAGIEKHPEVSTASEKLWPLIEILPPSADSRYLPHRI